MKKIALITIMACALGLAKAEDALQIRPATVAAGLTDDDEVCLEVEMRNSSFDVANLQFDILLPEGMEISYWDYGERIPFTKRGKTVKYDFDAQFNTLSNGYTRFVFMPGNEMRPITDGEDVLIYLYITTAADMEPGIYPVHVTNIHFDKSVTETLRIDDVSSYVVIGEQSPLQTASRIDLPEMSGYVPSFVVETMNEELSENPNLSMVNLKGVSELGGTLTLPENALWFTSTEASLNRTFPSGQWSTVCLPFDLPSEKIAELKNSGVEIEKLTTYDEAANEVLFAPTDEVSANQPYLVRPQAAAALFDVLTGITMADGQEPDVLTLDRVSMQGTYEKQVLNSGDEASYYVFNAANGEFVRVGKNGTVPPFRAYLTLTKGGGAKHIKVRHGDGEATVINQPHAQAGITGPTYDLSGRQVNDTKAAGVYIRNGQKFIKP